VKSVMKQTDAGTGRRPDAATSRVCNDQAMRSPRGLADFGKLLQVALLVLSIASFGSSAAAQTKKKTPRKSQPTALDNRVAKAKADLVAAAKDYKESLQKLLAFEEDDVKSATEKLEKRKALLSQNIISIKEV